jgi:hypothetical protein
MATTPLDRWKGWPMKNGVEQKARRQGDGLGRQGDKGPARRTVALGAFRKSETIFWCLLQIYRLFHYAVDIGRQLLAASSFIKQPCLYGPGCHPFRGLSGSSGFADL